MTTPTDPTTRTAAIGDKLFSLLVGRDDAYAIQHPDGTYTTPARETYPDGEPLAFDAETMRKHLTNPNKSYGHFPLVGKQAKFFCFDLDLNKSAKINVIPNLNNAGGDEYITDKRFDAWLERNTTSHVISPRDLLAKDPMNAWLRWQLLTIASLFEQAIERRLNISTLSSYSGGKGVHVYGFPEPGHFVDAHDLRNLAVDVIGSMGYWFNRRNRSNTLWEGNPELDCVNLFDVEIFPKQDFADPTKFGNLMRMELGTHQKSRQPGFFIDTKKSYMGELVAADPLFVMNKILGGA